MNLAFEKLRSAVAAAFRPRPSWRDAYLAALAERAWQAVELGQFPDAESCCLYVLKHSPTQGRARDAASRVAEAWTRSGDTHRAASQLNEARDYYERALVLQPESAALQVALGDVYVEAGRIADARPYYERALRISPDLPVALSRLAMTAAQAGQADAAEQLLLRVRDLAPGDLESLISLGLLYQGAGRLDQALECYRRAKAIDPVAPAAHVHTGFALLSRGEFEAGWDECEWRLRLPAVQRLREFDKPVWRGENPAGSSVLVQNEPTASDAIQMLRYVPLLARRGARVYVETVAELAPLVQRMPGVAGVVVSADDLARVAPTVSWRCPLLSLPHRFRTSRATIPSDVPYLQPDAARAAEWRARLAAHSSSRNIGLVGQAGSSIDLVHLFDALGQVPGTTFVTIQREPGTASDALVDWTGELRTFSDSADLIAALDLVIGPSTPFTHLAGAMGKPVWVLLPHVTDWRWSGGDASTPWYPTARLFRQSAAGDWTGVLRALADAARQL